MLVFAAFAAAARAARHGGCIVLKPSLYSPAIFGRSLADIRAIVEAVPACVVYLDASLRVQFVNRAAAAWLGQSAQSVRNRPLAELLAAPAFECAWPLLQKTLAGVPQRYQGKIRGPRGETSRVAAHFTPQRGAGVTLGVLVFMETMADDTIGADRLRVHERPARHLADHELALKQANAQLQEQIAQHRRAEALLDAEKRNMEMICSGENLQSVLEKLCESVEKFSQGGHCAILIADRARHGLIRDVTSSLPASFIRAVREMLPSDDMRRQGPVAFQNQPLFIEDIAREPAWENYCGIALAHDIRSVWLSPILSDAGEVLGTLMLYYSEAPGAPQLELALIQRTSHLAALAFNHEQSSRQLNYLATHDALTGLPNRHMFQASLSKAIAKSRRTASGFALMFIDLDRFKQVNDSLGHDIGDKLLKCVGQRLSKCMRREDMIARLGGDEFTVIIENFKEQRDVMGIAHKLQSALAAPFHIERQQLQVSCSIGIALYPEHGLDEDALLKNADATMYYAKSLGRNNYQTYVPAPAGQARSAMHGKGGHA